MRQIIGCVGLRRVNIVFGEMRIILDDVLDGVACREAAQDVLHRDARARDHGLAELDIWIALDAWGVHCAGRCLLSIEQGNTIAAKLSGQ